MPLCVGHEVIGRAIKVGKDVTTVKVGDRGEILSVVDKSEKYLLTFYQSVLVHKLAPT